LKKKKTSIHRTQRKAMEGPPHPDSRAGAQRATNATASVVHLGNTVIHHDGDAGDDDDDDDGATATNDDAAGVGPCGGHVDVQQCQPPSSSSDQEQPPRHFPDVLSVLYLLVPDTEPKKIDIGKALFVLYDQYHVHAPETRYVLWFQLGAFLKYVYSSALRSSNRRQATASSSSSSSSSSCQNDALLCSGGAGNGLGTAEGSGSPHATADGGMNGHDNGSAGTRVQVPDWLLCALKVSASQLDYRTYLPRATNLGRIKEIRVEGHERSSIRNFIHSLHTAMFGDV
jgi:hypothetical protein